MSKLCLAILRVGVHAASEDIRSLTLVSREFSRLSQEHNWKVSQ